MPAPSKGILLVRPTQIQPQQSQPDTFANSDIAWQSLHYWRQTASRPAFHETDCALIDVWQREKFSEDSDVALLEFNEWPDLL